MSSRYDLENLLSDLKAILVANLNTKIAAIEAEKIALGFPATGLAPVDSTNGYFEQSWSDRILNYSPAIFYGVEGIEASGMGEATAETFKLFIEVVIVDSGMDLLAKNRIYRYSRAIKEVLEENSRKLPMGGMMKIETVRPISFKLELNSSEEIKVGGVSLTTAIA